MYMAIILLKRKNKRRSSSHLDIFSSDMDHTEVRV